MIGQEMRGLWLFTVANWYATKRAAPMTFENVQERIESLVTRSSFNEGIRMMKEYSDEFKKRYCRDGKGSVMEYRLISAVQIPDDADVDALSDLGVHELNRAYIDHLKEEGR